MTEIGAHGLAVEVPTGWEGRIFRRPEAGEGATGSDAAGTGVVSADAPMGERTHPVLHAATVPLPADMADYGSDVVEDLGVDDALIVIKEFDAGDAGQPLFERDGMPRSLSTTDFDLGTLQRSLAGQGGHQTFFHENGRAFCLYVVLGSFDRRGEVVAAINTVLASVRIGPLGGS